MDRIHRRAGGFYQAIVGCALLAMLPAAALAQTEEAPLRFGDPESVFESPTAPSTPTSPSAARSNEPGANLSSRIRSIIQGVPPGEAYPKELDELTRLGEDAVPTLVQIFKDASAMWQWRWTAAMALGRLGGANARAALEAGLQDPLFLVRMASIQALTHMGDLRSAPLIRGRLSDRALVVRSDAVDSLTRLNDRDSVTALTKELSASRNFHNGKSLWIREKILDSLGELRDEKATRALMSVLRESELHLREKACEALSKIYPIAPPANVPSPETDCATQWIHWRATLQR